MKTKFNWSEPYCNISYLETNKRYHVAMCGMNDKVVEGYILNKDSNTPFTAFFQIFGDLDFVKKELEKKAKQLGILT